MRMRSLPTHVVASQQMPRFSHGGQKPLGTKIVQYRMGQFHDRITQETSRDFKDKGKKNKLYDDNLGLYFTGIAIEDLTSLP